VDTVLPFNDKLLLRVLRDDVDSIIKWNITVKSAKILKKFSESLSIIYVCVKDQASGLVTSRDFVNMSKYVFHENKHVIAVRACPNYEYSTGENIIR
jgi:hypothetical protein